MFKEMKIRVFVGLMIVFAVVAEWILTMYDLPEIHKRLISDFVTFETVALLFFGYYFYKQKTPLHTVVSEGREKISVLSILGIALIFNVFSLTSYWFYLYIQYSLVTLNPFVILHPTGSPFLLIFMMITSTLTAPISEEFVFRGLLLNRLIKKTNMWLGILISSLAFASVHMQWEKLFATFLFGVIASLIYLKTKSLFVPILLHIVHNAIVFIQTSIFPAWTESLFLASSDDIHVNVVLKSTLLVISFLLMIFIIVYLARSIYSDRRKVAEKSQPEEFPFQPETISSQ
ncbi:CPBP family intramembrane metalloprotease [Paenisporosarcina quisquiliarum]|uniref:CPBP family intramembrane metalloprotease n=1 Tax=Paenisporosarcina quisquiliarum TaxID=365346 RepID=A0A9X3LI15_9BACL|nr:type II CAAX endopeptidase family protein [Paenisporosarcina quisquiliarum]MCZ8538318.1 CPBP family intramembrane metalloprotease [Paenisporosarcina quisquiliarum]